MFREITPAELIRDFDNFLLVDIRSPSEYREFHIPGAVNIPLFDDEEKKFIGDVYRLKGQETAKEEGIKLVSPKLYHFYKRFKELEKKGKQIVIYCWRGGMRSVAMCSFLSGTGIKVMRLEGGYRAFRRYILEDMKRIIKEKSFIVLTGKTGVGKTALLRDMEREGFPVVDLEKLAKDRGSAFGKVGMRENTTQKMFDADLYFTLRNIRDTVIFIEDESRRIGNIHLPEDLYMSIVKGFRVELNTTLEERIRNIEVEYLKNVDISDIMEAVYKINKYLGKEGTEYVLNLIRDGKLRETIRFLIENYYDRTYKRVRGSDTYIFFRTKEFVRKELKRIFASFYTSLS